MSDNQPSDQDWKPRPDPTVLTTEALHREIGMARELLAARIDHIAAITDQRFAQIDQRFTSLEAARLEHKADTKSAVDSALTAQKEAVKEQTIASDRAISKSETSITRQLEQLGGTVATAVEGLRRDIDDVKARLGMIEATKAGGKEATTERRESHAAVYAAIGGVLSILLIGGIVIAALS